MVWAVPVQGVVHDAVGVQHLQHAGRELRMELVAADGIGEQPIEGVEINFYSRVAPCHDAKAKKKEGWLMEIGNANLAPNA